MVGDLGISTKDRGILKAYCGLGTVLGLWQLLSQLLSKFDPHFTEKNLKLGEVIKFYVIWSFRSDGRKGLDFSAILETKRQWSNAFKISNN